MKDALSALTCVLLAAGLAAGCAGTGAPADDARPPDDLALLAAWMTGSFSSATQAAADPDHYYDIRLEMAPIWPDRTDGVWFYVEQAAAASLARPYRQRVYRVWAPAPGLLASEVFALTEPELAVGAWRSAAPLDGLGPADLLPRAGCTVYLRRTGPDRFAGGTRERDCASDLRGATYATSEIRVFADRLESWDRGFDREGEQVWGAESGPYIFLKVE